MDFVNKFTGGDKQQSNQQQQPLQGSSSGEQKSGGFLGGIGDKLNSAAGGGRESEKNEDYLDKGVDFVQEKFMGGGPQDNEVCHDHVIAVVCDHSLTRYSRPSSKPRTNRSATTSAAPTSPRPAPISPSRTRRPASVSDRVSLRHFDGHDGL
jgi:hypothetical protein